MVPVDEMRRKYKKKKGRKDWKSLSSMNAQKGEIKLNVAFHKKVESRVDAARIDCVAQSSSSSSSAWSSRVVASPKDTQTDSERVRNQRAKRK